MADDQDPRGRGSTDDEEDSKSDIILRYEWESELEEYDEPDVYPSEKDYKMVEEEVTDSEEEEKDEEKDQHEEDVIVPETVEQKKPLEPTRADSVLSEGGKPTSGEETKQAELEVEEEGAEEKEEVFVPSGPELEEEEVQEPPKKKYKKILVRKLIERPPKVHYEPAQERNEYSCDDMTMYPKRPFELVYSFGYDSQRMANIHVLDERTMVFMSGFMLTFFDHRTKEKKYLRCLGGSCFGALAIHPSKKLFAAAEKGERPVIGIWSWPKLQLFRILQDGTDKMYASVNFSPDGSLLASQGGEPDYLITVWNWLGETPVLRVKSHVQDIYRVTFSKELAGWLTTSGLCHIKFWKMANTFTGLKLKGDLGRFGKTELSDIEGYIEMADGKVVSGSEWGNLLVWENGLMVAEICLSPEIPCHAGIVRTVLIVEGEFYTTGQDGFVKTWDYDSIDTAENNTTEESSKVSLKCKTQVLVGETADVWSIVPDIPCPTSSSVLWFAQDGKGLIWKVDLSFLHSAKEPEIILDAHGGPIVGCGTSRMSCLLATLGADGQVRVVDYMSRKLVARRLFNAQGSCFLWPPSVFDYNAATLIAGFADGTLRILTLSGEKSREGLPLRIILRRCCKPHSKSITTMAVDREGEFFVTGSEDGTIFFFHADNNFEPLTFIDAPGYNPVRHVQWSLNYKDISRKILIACDGGIIQELKMPGIETIDNSVTYQYLDSVNLRSLNFKSVKSQLRHNEDLERERIAEEKRQAALDEDLRRKVQEGVETQSEQDLRLLQETEEKEKQNLLDPPPKKPKWEPYIPPEASPILAMVQSNTQDDTLYLSMGKYDAGYLYSVELVDLTTKEKMGSTAGEPASASPMYGTNDVPITTIVLSDDGNQVFFGLEDGRVRVQQLIFSYDFEHLGAYWMEGVHDCVRGAITGIVFDKDNTFIITCGNDGNCFLHSFLSQTDLENFELEVESAPIPKSDVKEVNDIEDPNAYTLEVFKKVAKEMELLAQAKRNKAQKLEEIVLLRSHFFEAMKKNFELPPEVRLSPVELSLSKDFGERKAKYVAFQLEELKKEMAWEKERCRLLLGKVQNLYKSKLESELFFVKAFNSCLAVSSFRAPKLPWFYNEAKEMIDTQRTPEKIDSDLMDDDLSSTQSMTVVGEPKPKRKPGMDKFVYQRLVRLWERKQKKLKRQQVWKDFLETEPKGKDRQEEDRAIEEAGRTMGDMKLKIADDYKVPDNKKLTVHRARKRLVSLEQIMYDMRNTFNKQLEQLREEKLKCIYRMQDLSALANTHQNLLHDKAQIPHVDSMTFEEDPEKYFRYTKGDILEFKRSREAIRANESGPAPAKMKKNEVRRKLQHANMLMKKQMSTQKINKVAIQETGKEESRDIGCYVEFVTSTPTLLEEEIERNNNTINRFYRNHYIEKMEEEKFKFDVKLRLLHHRKIHLDYLLKTADARMVLLTEEFLLAQNSEAMEKSIENKITDATKEKKESTTQLKNLTKKQDALKKDLDNVAKQKTALLNEVLNISSKAPAFEKYLVRVLKKKKAKKASKTELEDELTSAGSDDESNESSDMDLEDEEDDDDGLDVDLPPAELNKEIYDQVLEVRERRYVAEEAEEQLKEQYDTLTAACNVLKNKSIAADKAIERGRGDLNVFISEKQHRQNDIDVAVSLKRHQVHYMSENLGQALVTPMDAITRLRNRIPELKKEKKAQKQMVIEDKKRHRQLFIEKLKFMRRIEEKEKLCDVEMKKKFGVVVPLDVLENFDVDKEVAALRDEIHEQEKERLAISRALETETRKALDKKMELTNEQTTRLQFKANILTDINNITKSMDDSMRKMPTQVTDPTIAREIAKLESRVIQQWHAIQELNLQIAEYTNREVRPLPPIKYDD